MTAPPPAATPPPEPAEDDVVVIAGMEFIDAPRPEPTPASGVASRFCHCHETGQVLTECAEDGECHHPYAPAPGVSAAPTTTSSDASGETRDALVKAVRHAWVEAIPARWADLAVDAALAALAPAARGESPARPGAPAPGPDTARDGEVAYAAELADPTSLRNVLASVLGCDPRGRASVDKVTDLLRERDDLKAAVERLCDEADVLATGSVYVASDAHVPVADLRALLTPPDAGRDTG